MPARIVVGYIATPGGRDALALGERIARTLGGGLDIVLVLPPEPMWATRPDPEEGFVSAQADTWLAEAGAAVGEDVDVRLHLRYDDSFTAGLLEAAVEFEAVVVVVGGSGGGSLARFTLGPVANEMLHSFPLPVAVAPRGYADDAPETITRVTVAVGDRPGADLLLDTALASAYHGEVPLRLISLLALDPTLLDRLRGRATEGEDIAVAQINAAFAKARGLVDGPDITTVIGEGSTLEEAAEALDWQPGDVLLVGSSRLAQPRRTFLGSTAARMLRVVPVPMVVVPRTGETPFDVPPTDPTDAPSTADEKA